MLKRALFLLVALTGCARGGPEGAFLSETLPLEVKRQKGEVYSVTVGEDLLFLTRRTGHVLAPDDGKTVTIEFDEAWQTATLRDVFLKRDFFRVPLHELDQRIEQARQREEEAAERALFETQVNQRHFSLAKQLLADGQYQDSVSAFQALAERAPDYEREAVQNYIRMATDELADEARLQRAEKQLDKGQLDAAEATLAGTNPETLQAMRRGELLDRLKAARGK
jgi:hypothetical protein